MKLISVALKFFIPLTIMFCAVAVATAQREKGKPNHRQDHHRCQNNWK